MAVINSTTIRKLHTILRKGTVDELQALLDELPIVDLSTLRTKSDQTPLHTAISHHPSAGKLVHLLLTYKHPTNIRGCFTQNVTPLHQACQRGEVECAKALLKHGADVEMIKRGDWTALMLTCGGRLHGTADSEGEHCMIVRELLKHGAVIRRVNFLKETAMHLAAKTCARCLTLLTQHGGNCAGWRTRNGRTTLHYAAYTANVEAIQGLLQREGPEFVCAVDSSGMNAWHQLAASNAERSADAMRVLCEYDEDGFWKTDVAGFNTLHHAACSGNENILEDAIRRGEVSEERVRRTDKTGCTAERVANMHGHERIVQLLSGMQR